MITETMSLAEMCKEYLKDLAYFDKKMGDCFGERSKIRRWLLKYHKKNEGDLIHLRTYTKKRNGNTYLVVLATHGFKEFDKHGPMCLMILLYRRSNSINCLFFTNNSKMGVEPTVFVSHFFDRYRERVLKDTTLTKMETIQKFFGTNHMFDFDDPVDSEKHSNSIVGYCKEGIVFGEKENSCNIIKTIVSCDMFKDSNDMESSQVLAWKFRSIIVKHNGKITEAQKQEYLDAADEIKDSAEREAFKEMIEDYFEDKEKEK